MGSLAPALFAFLAGLTVAGLVATLVEIATRVPVAFAEPHLSPRRIVRSVALTAVAGPYMLGNEALDAFHRGTINAVRLATYAMVAATWALALGVLVLSLASSVLDLLA
ncbi:MAG: hypothetical protein KF723_21810 [Rhizobiaceae bacterium]|nr:hypothetical protein [Rhizobiaceae bacterium]